MEDIEIDSVMVLARTVEARRAIERQGGEVWQRIGAVTDSRKSLVRWNSYLMKVPYPAAVRLGILPAPARAQPKAATPAKTKRRGAA